MRTMNHSDGRTRYKIAFLKFISDTSRPACAAVENRWVCSICFKGAEVD